MIINPSKDDIIIQPIEWISNNQNYKEIYEEYPGNNRSRKFIIRAFGCTQDGRSVSVNIMNFNPFFYLSFPEFLEKSDGAILLNKIKRICSDLGKEWHTKSIVNWEIVKKRQLYGYSNLQFKLYFKLVFNNSDSMGVVARSITEYGINGTYGETYTKPLMLKNKSTSLQIYESNLNPMLKFYHISEIKPHGWIRIPAGQYVMPDVQTTTCNIDIFTRWDCVKPYQLNKFAPFIIACFDIECTSVDGSFPQASRPSDKIIQIGTTVNRYGEDVSLKHIVTLKKSLPIEGSIVECYDKEDDLLIGWANFIHSLDPDVISGYNIFGFDLAYIYKRAEQCGLFDPEGGTMADLLTRVSSMPAKYKEKMLSSSGLGDNELKYIEMPGRLVFDVFKVIQPEYKLEQYTLNSVSNYFLGDSKQDLSPAQLFANYKSGTPENIQEIATYCIQDCALCNKLISKLNMIPGKSALSNVCYIPMSFLFMRGQGIRSHSLMACECRIDHSIVPNIKKILNNEGGYEGAVVLQPSKGMYLEDPIPVLDFASLYPSSIISENLSHNTIIIDENYNNLPFVDYLDIEYDVFEGKGDEKVKTGIKKCRFAQNHIGIIPMLLKKLLAKRKETKKEMMAAQGNEFLFNLKETEQLAYKITANSVYGQMGAATSPICLVDVAASTTSTGRMLLNFAKWFSEVKFPDLDNYDPDYKVVECKSVYGDTDSVFLKYIMHDKDGNKITGKKALAVAIKKGIRCGIEISKYLKPPHDLEYEKTFWPFCLFTKKRYVGNLYETDPNKFKMKPMGIVLKRRDNAQIVKYIYGGVINIILNEQNIEKSKDFLKTCLDELIKGQFPLEMLTVTKSLKANYKTVNKNGGELPLPPHKMMVDRMRERDQDFTYNAGDRVPFIYVALKENKTFKLTQGHKIETPSFIIKNNLQPAYSIYITNQIMTPVVQLFSLIMDEKKASSMFDEVLRIEKNKSKGNIEITKWFTTV
jgi:DNA polymerase delta subunit 1